MNVRAYSESVESFERNLDMVAYFNGKESFTRQVMIWQQDASTLEEFLSWAKSVVLAEYAYRLEREFGTPFTVEFVAFSQTELYMLDALWYG